MERDMRQQLFDHYEELSFSYYSQNNSGQMMSKLVSDLFDISEFAHHGPENLFISLVKIVGAFIFLFFINKKLALPLILLVIVMFVFSFRQNAKMQETFMENKIDSKTLAIEIAKILDKKKAHDVRVLKVESLTVLTDYFVIASGTSTTQVASLADEVEYELSQKGIEPYTTEGFDSKNWVLLDYSNVIVHVFVPNSRAYYDLEHLWADGEPVDISEYLTPDSSIE